MAVHITHEDGSGLSPVVKLDTKVLGGFERFGGIAWRIIADKIDAGSQLKSTKTAYISVSFR